MTQMLVADHTRTADRTRTTDQTRTTDRGRTADRVGATGSCSDVIAERVPFFTDVLVRLPGTNACPLDLAVVRSFFAWTTTASASFHFDLFFSSSSRRINIFDAPTAVNAASDEQTVKWTKETSGLTWEQLGKVFGVSRRAVHLWATGGKINAANAALVHEFAAAVRSVEGLNPAQTRAALLAVGADGTSIVDKFRSRRRTGSGEISGTPFKPIELFGPTFEDATDEDTGPSLREIYR